MTERLDHEYEIFFKFVRTIALIVSPNLKKKISSTYFISMLPIYSKNEIDILGFNLLWKSNDCDYYTPFYNDQNHFLSPKYSTDIMWIDQRKIFMQDSSPSEYLTLVDCQFKRSIVNSNCFDQFEQRYLLEHARKSVMNMLKYNLEHYLC